MKNLNKGISPAEENREGAFTPDFTRSMTFLKNLF